MLSNNEENKSLLCITVLLNTIVMMLGEKAKQESMQLSDESCVEQASLPVVINLWMRADQEGCTDS